MLGFLGRLTGVTEGAACRSSPPRRTVPGSSRWSSCTARRRASSAGPRCINRLQADPEIRSRYQFWFFQYDSGNPIVALRASPA